MSQRIRFFESLISPSFLSPLHHVPLEAFPHLVDGWGTTIANAGEKVKQKVFPGLVAQGTAGWSGGLVTCGIFWLGGTVYVVGWLRRHSFATQILGAWTAAVFAVGDLQKKFCWGATTSATGDGQSWSGGWSAVVNVVARLLKNWRIYFGKTASKSLKCGGKPAPHFLCSMVVVLLLKKCSGKNFKQKSLIDNYAWWGGVFHISQLMMSL